MQGEPTIICQQMHAPPGGTEPVETFLGERAESKGMNATV